MSDRRFPRRALVGGSLAAAALAGVGLTPAAAQPVGIGVTPERALRLRPDVTFRQLVVPGQVFWLVAGFGGSPQSFALTAHYAFPDPTSLDPGFELSIQFRRLNPFDEPYYGVTPGNWPSFGKLGVMSTPENEEPGTRYWFTNTGRGRDFYIRVANNTPRTYGLAITNHAEGYALRWTDPPVPVEEPVEEPVDEAPAGWAERPAQANGKFGKLRPLPPRDRSHAHQEDRRGHDGHEHRFEVRRPHGNLARSQRVQRQPSPSGRSVPIPGCGKWQTSIARFSAATCSSSARRVASACSVSRSNATPQVGWSA